MQAYSSQNTVPYKVLDGFICQLSRKAVEVQIDGKPEDDQSERMQTAIVSPESPGGRVSWGAGSAERKAGAGRISVVIGFGDGGQPSWSGLVGLRMLVEKLEVLC